MMDRNEFRAALKAAGLKQNQLAAVLGRSVATVQRWAQGQAAVPPEASILLRLLAEGRLRPEEIVAARLGLSREEMALALRLATALMPQRSKPFEWIHVEPLDDQAARLLEAAKVMPARRPSVTRPPIMWWVVKDGGNVVAAGDAQLASKAFLEAVEEQLGSLEAIQLIMDAGAAAPAWRMAPERAALMSAITSATHGGFRLRLDGRGLLMAPVSPAEAREKAIEVLHRILAWMPPDAQETIWLMDVLAAPHRLIEADEAEIGAAAERIERLLADHPPSDDSLPGAAATAALWALHGRLPPGSDRFALALEEAAGA